MSTESPPSLETRVEALDRDVAVMAKALTRTTENLTKAMRDLTEAMSTTNATAIATAKGLAEQAAEGSQRMGAIYMHLLALQWALQAGGVLTEQEVRNKVQPVSDALTLELEHADTPDAVLFRELRRFIKGQIKPPAAEPGPPTPPGGPAA